ncbi:MAG: hypothetical protein JNK05_25940 [Myxococcales bacterium]|nr:hypothetical protein [Myxococcales bacterium]
MKIPALDVTLLASAALVLVTGFARAALGRAGVLASTHPASGLVSLVTLVPLAFVAYVLWKGAPVRATGWRRVSARVTAVLLWLLALTSSVVSAGLPVPEALSLAPKSALVVSASLVVLAACVWATSPARQGVRRRRAK